MAGTNKNDPKKKAIRQKIVGKCGHEVTPILVKGIRGPGRMMRDCQQCGRV